MKSKNAITEMKNAHKNQPCCNETCKNEAEFHIQDISEGAPYEAQTYSCSAHLGEMIDGDGLHEIYRLTESDRILKIE